MAYDIFLKQNHKNYSRMQGWVSSVSARAAADQVFSDLQILNDLISVWYKTVASQKIPAQAAFVNAWMRFRDITYQNIEEAKKTFTLELASDVLARMRVIQENLVEWKNKYQKISGIPYAGIATSLTPVPVVPPDKGASPWGYVVVGLGSVVLVGGVLGYLLVPKLLAGGAMAGAGSLLGRAKA